MSNHNSFFENMFPKTAALDVTGLVEDIRLNFPFYHDVNVVDDMDLKEIVIWSIENLGGVSDQFARWCLCDMPAGVGDDFFQFRFYFKFVEDQIAFKLRWI